MIMSKAFGVSGKNSEHCDVVSTTACALNDDTYRAIAEGLDRARSLPEFGANGKSAVDRSSCTSSDGGSSSRKGAPSS